MKAAEPKEWPGFSWDDYARFLAETKENAMGGRHLDVFTGSFRRVRNQQTMAKGWLPVPASKTRAAATTGRTTPTTSSRSTTAGRELAILRLTSNSDLSGQTYRGKAMYGFSVLRLSKRADARRYGHPQINAVRFFLNDGGSASLVSELALDRTKTVANAQVDGSNPICGLFRGAGAEACR